jgi:imidazoleglycerol-phosphate dehydratase
MTKENPTPRQANVKRQTNETSISAHVNLDGTGKVDVSTGLGFFDHMIEQLGRHSLIDITLNCQGDLHIDAHHTVEDCGWALGDTFNRALGDRRGITRYGLSFLPMDEALTRIAIDISGRPYLIWNVTLPSPRLGDMDTEVFEEFFRAFSQSAGVTLHVETCYGSNTHHIIESSFKALAQACKMAIAIDPRQADRIPSTKGVL